MLPISPEALAITDRDPRLCTDEEFAVVVNEFRRIISHMPVEELIWALNRVHATDAYNIRVKRQMMRSIALRLAVRTSDSEWLNGGSDRPESEVANGEGQGTTQASQPSEGGANAHP